MRVLHYYPLTDSMIAQHVTILTNSMGLEVENHLATDSSKARTLLEDGSYDLLHLHGCWRNSLRTMIGIAQKQGVRIVVTPHGQLEPWVVDQNYWKEKLPKQLLYQRDIIRQAYAIIIQGKMEQECMKKLAWNPRCVIVRNAVITRSTTAEAMAKETYAIYRKVMDSNPLQLMSDETLEALGIIIKAGITGDTRWFDTPPSPVSLPQESWRQLLCYAHQEQITSTIERGLQVLRCTYPDIDASQIPYFLPADYQQVSCIGESIGNQFASENDRLLATFRLVRKLIASRQLSIRHLIEIDQELRQHHCEEDALGETLKEHKLWTLAGHIMQLLSELTGFTEGFMPVPPLNDRTTRQIKRQIENHLKI